MNSIGIFSHKYQQGPLNNPDILNDYLAEGQRYPSGSFNNLAGRLIGLARADAMFPLIPTFPAQHKQAAGRQVYRDFFRGLYTTEFHHHRSAQRQGCDIVFEAGLTVHMGGDSLTRFVFVDYELIGFYGQIFSTYQQIQQSGGPDRQFADFHASVNLSRFIVVFIAVMLNPTAKVTQPDGGVNFAQ